MHSVESSIFQPTLKRSTWRRVFRMFGVPVRVAERSRTLGEIEKIASVYDDVSSLLFFSRWWGRECVRAPRL